MLVEEKTTELVIGAAIKVHRALGPGLLESVYEACLAHEIAQSGLSLQRQVQVPIVYETSADLMAVSGSICWWRARSSSN